MSLFKGIISGEPGTAKSSLLATLANVGYNVLRCAFEPGEEVYDAYCTAEGRQRLHNLYFEDDWELNGDDDLARVPQGMKAFDRFLWYGEYGGKKEYPYGRPADWTNNIVIGVDTLTSLGDCAEAHALKLNSSTREGRHLWAAAQAQERACQALVGKKRLHHTVVLAHFRLISPKAESGYKDETDLQKQIKRERASLEDTGYYPTAVTPNIARNFVGNFPFALLTELGGHSPSGRIIRTKPIKGYQVKCPLQNIGDKLPIETGLVTIFETLGCQP